MTAASQTARAIAAAALLAGLLGAGPTVLRAAPPPGGFKDTSGKAITIARVSAAPKIDGKLNDPMWLQATRITDLTQFQPGDGTAPTEQSEFLLAYDDDNLYVAARFHDSEPEKIKRSQLVQGQTVINDDYAQVLLDPYNSKRAGYIFYVNPNGVQRDGLALGGMAFNMDWDGIWEGDAEVTADGWTAEMAFPFKTLSFDPHNDTWGINLLRSIRRKREEIAWSHRERQITMDAAGEIRGLQGMRQGRGFDIVPSLALSRRETFATGASAITSKPAVDAFWRITPSLTAALTLNTDFSSTEVDDRQVNLTRFSLFFPEKRDFFLSDADIFEFGGLAQNGKPFFSRTIGLSAAGQPIDLDVGAKLTGHIGRWGIGAVAVRQAANGSVDARDLLVGRAYWSFLEQSTLGAIVTSGDPTSNSSNRVAGIDLDLRDRKFFNGQTIEGRMWAQQSQTPGRSGDDAAWGASLAWPNDRVDALVSYTRIGTDFHPALGFVNRTGIRQLEARAKLRERFAGSPVFRSWLGGFDFREIRDGRDELESRVAVFTPFTLDTQPGDQFSVDVSRDTEVLSRPFALPGGYVVPAARYDFDRLRFYGTSAGFRRFAFNADVEAGRFYLGRRLDTKLGVQWRAGRRAFFNAQYQTNRIDMPARDFTARVYSLTANFAFDVRWAWLNVMQYDNVSGRLGLNSRLRWLSPKGQAAYLVLNYDWREDALGNFRPFVAETTAKINYTFRF